MKESGLPYVLEHLRLARMSFDLWGALSPVGTRSPPGTEEKGEQNTENGSSAKESSSRKHSAERRSISQAELESSLYKVIIEYNKIQFCIKDRGQKLSFCTIFNVVEKLYQNVPTSFAQNSIVTFNLII